jgi:hypothetical protein
MHRLGRWVLLVLRSLLLTLERTCNPNARITSPINKWCTIGMPSHWTHCLTSRIFRASFEPQRNHAFGEYFRNRKQSATHFAFAPSTTNFIPSHLLSRTPIGSRLPWCWLAYSSSSSSIVAPHHASGTSIKSDNNERASTALVEGGTASRVVVLSILVIIQRLGMSCDVDCDGSLWCRYWKSQRA